MKLYNNTLPKPAQYEVTIHLPTGESFVGIIGTTKKDNADDWWLLRSVLNGGLK